MAGCGETRFLQRGAAIEVARFFRFVEKKRGERRTGSNLLGSLGEAVFCGSLFLLGTLLCVRSSARSSFSPTRHARVWPRHAGC